jgi:hypothetical protein
MSPVPPSPHPRQRQRRRVALLVSLLLIASLCLPWLDKVFVGMSAEARNEERSIFSGIPGFAVFLIGSVFCPPLAMCPLLSIMGIRALLRNRWDDVFGFALATLVLTPLFLAFATLMIVLMTGPQLMFLGTRRVTIGIGFLVWCAAILILLVSSRLCGHADEWTNEHPLADFLQRHRRAPA